MKLYLKTKDFSISNEEFNLFHDEELDMLVTRPQPENLDLYYDSDVYISHTDAKNSLIDRLYQVVKRFNLKRKLSLASKYCKGEKRILDIGAGTGDFILMARQKGWSYAGIEPNVLARAKSHEKGIELSENLEEVKGRKFKIITLWHVLEHLPNLEKQIEDIKGFLDDDGALIIAVPNFRSHDAAHYKKYWAAYDVPRHLWHFSKKAIAGIFAKHQMKVIKTKPMWFDSFYVSILSEKYKGKRFSIFGGFFHGLYSNIKALGSKEHSSLIYVLKKT